MEKLNAYFTKNILFKNSLYLIASNGFLSFGGFIFWIFVARLYSTYQIGIATSLIAVVSLLSSLALLGFTTGIIRFLPTTKDKDVLINSTFSLVGLFSFILGLTTAIKIGFFSPPLAFITKNPYFFIFFIVLTVFASLNSFLEAVLIAFRSSKYVLIKNIVQSAVKLILPFLFIGLGGYGIFSSYFGCGIISLAVGGFLLYRKHNVIYRIHVNAFEVKKIATLSIGTYLAGLMSNVTQYVIPILVTNILGAEQTAFYYIVLTTTNVLNIIPGVVAQNLMVEGSYETEKIGIHLKKSIQITLIILLPLILLMIFFGNYVLLVFGKKYSTEGLVLLRLLSVCSVFVGVNSILSAIIVVFKKIKLLIIANTIFSVLLFVISYYFIRFGIVGIGYAAILSQFISILLYLFALVKMNKLFLLKSIWL